MDKITKLKIGCHVSAAGGLFNAPKNAAELGCETFQIFTRPPMGGKAPELTEENIEKFKIEMKKYNLDVFVVHCPYFVNFGSREPRIYHGSISVVSDELKRSNLLGAKYVMTHLGSGKDLGEKDALKQAKKGLTEVLKKYKGDTQFLLEIAAGSGATLGGTFEHLAELMKPLVKFKTFGGICFDTQHAFASGYDIRDKKSVAETFKKFNEIIGLKWLKMSHINDSKIELGGKKDRHDHIGDGKIGEKGFLALIRYFETLSLDMPLIFETEHDKVERDMEILKKLRNKI
ncbi:MAG: deoxyribonuclease IV [Candidatus Doudnabacteria bacterium]|nr:deoxyribonuclease IV [Candidatus Doudnabacteria bacterium]